MLIHYFKVLLLGFWALFMLSCTSAIRFSSSNTIVTTKKANNTYPFYEEGFASYYSDDFLGRKTASGEIYSHENFTAAHRTLPFGTLVRVHNLSNGKEVTVRINDRGPFVEGRIIDLSRSAAEKIDLLNFGICRVGIELIK